MDILKIDTVECNLDHCEFLNEPYTLPTYH